MQVPMYTHSFQHKWPDWSSHTRLRTQRAPSCGRSCVRIMRSSFVSHIKITFKVKMSQGGPRYYPCSVGVSVLLTRSVHTCTMTTVTFQSELKQIQKCVMRSQELNHVHTHICVARVNINVCVFVHCTVCEYAHNMLCV